MYIQVVLIVSLAQKILGKIEIFPQVSNFIQYGENEICKTESDIYKRNLGNYTMWAHKMLDSSAKGAFGVLRGNDHQFGNYDECLNVQGPFPTQYCLVGLTLNVPAHKYLRDIHGNKYGTIFSKLEHHKIKNVKFGMCFPSSCSASDIQTSLNETLNNLENPFEAVGVTYTVTSSKEFCSDYVYPKRFGVLETTFCFLTVAMVIFAAIGTMKDCLGRLEESGNKFWVFFNNFCLSFSIRRNWNKLFKGHDHQDEASIFNGIRSISALFIFFGHFAVIFAFIPCLEGLTIDEMFNSKVRFAVEKLDLIVDIFFLLGGLLLVHGVFKKWRTAYFNPILLIFLRYIRLTPLNMYVTLYFATILPYFGSGPIWNFAYVMSIKSCLQNNNWWLNFFYINNFMTDPTALCNEVTWYISCDFQLFIVGVLVLFIMKKNVRAGYAIIGFLIILSILVSFTITKMYDIVPYMDTFESEEYKLYLNYYYNKPYTRASSYFLGMLGGIIYDKLKSKQVKISKINSYAITGISLFVMSGSYAYLMFAYNGQENYMFEFALYNALHRPIWCIGFLGICIVTSFGSIPAIRLFLSSSFWTPFAKLTYGFYLIHMIVQYATITTSKTGMGSGFFEPASLSFALLVFSLIISIFLYVIVEAPFTQIFRISSSPKLYKKANNNM